ncbi:MAG TPA: hypothetical protein VFW78_07640 [Bacteroidia bacterium]|nr:hypothetical protein [Bacteroidia bacterium]
MYLQFRNIILVLLLFHSVHVKGQLTAAQRDSIHDVELQLKNLTDSMTKGTTEHARSGALAAFNPLFYDLLDNPSTFEYSFDSLKTISVMRSPDGKLKVFTWVFIDRTAETYTYYGVVQARKGKSKEIKRTGLVDTPYERNEADTSELYPEKWFGAVYYDIMQKKVGSTMYYLLIGWRGHTKTITRKVIDVITLNEWGDPLFGKPVFQDEKGNYTCRHVFEFSSQAVMLLRFNHKKSAILFDHLSAPSPGLKGQYNTYGPDFTYDGYTYKKGKWLYKSNLDVKNPAQ